MGEKLNRQLQREILARLSDDYPNQTDMGSSFNLDDNTIAVNVAYLEEFGLVDASWDYDEENGRRYPSDAKISARGLDFLADDGGLGAILGIVTVKLHDDTLKSLLIERVSRSEGNNGIKTKLIAKIKELPAEAVNDIAKRILERGLDNLPTAVDALMKFFTI